MSSCTTNIYILYPFLVELLNFLKLFTPSSNYTNTNPIVGPFSCQQIKFCGILKKRLTGKKDWFYNYYQLLFCILYLDLLCQRCGAMTCYEIALTLYIISDKGRANNQLIVYYYRVLVGPYKILQKFNSKTV